MTRRISAFPALLMLACAASVGSPARARDDSSRSREIPAAFAPFEYLVGQWTGQGIPKDSGAQQFRGWTEKHAWAWIFSKGKPSGLSFTIEGGKILASGKLTFDPERNLYRLEGKEPGTLGKATALEGKFDSSGKQLVLEQVGKEGRLADSAGQMRVSLRPNANYIRYTMTQERKAPDAAVFTRTIEVGVKKEGETFAAGTTASERLKCIVTGGLATMSVTFEGKTFPLCCSGCLGEFNDNPEKYVKKAALMLTSQAGKPKLASKARGRDDAFAADVVDSSESPRPAAKAKKNESPSAGKMAKADADDGGSTDAAKSTDKPAPKKDTARSAPAKTASRAATLVRLGRTLERAGKTDQALANYREVVKDFPNTPSGKTAAERIKALEQKD